MFSSRLVLSIVLQCLGLAASLPKPTTTTMTCRCETHLFISRRTKTCQDKRTNNNRILFNLCNRSVRQLHPPTDPLWVGSCAEVPNQPSAAPGSRVARSPGERGRSTSNGKSISQYSSPGGGEFRSACRGVVELALVSIGKDIRRDLK